MASRGVLLCCNNNGVFPYHKLVPICAWFIKKHLGVPICVAADESTLAAIQELDGIFGLVDHLILLEHSEPMGQRLYYTSIGELDVSQSGPFLNTNRRQCYDISPFDETLMMDVDFIVFNDVLNSVWGSDSPLRMNSTTAGLTHDKPAAIAHVHPLSIAQQWATVVYFRKSSVAETFFEGIEFVQNHYDYFADQYRFSSHLYRNDFAFSIMAHAMNGGVGENAIQWPIQALPEPTLLFAWDAQPLLQIDAHRAWFAATNTTTSGEIKPTPVLLQNQSVHVINKSSLLEVAGPWVEQQMGSL